jgi:hypothetical protein
VLSNPVVAPLVLVRLLGAPPTGGTHLESNATPKIHSQDPLPRSTSKTPRSTPKIHSQDQLPRSRSQDPLPRSHTQDPKIHSQDPLPRSQDPLPRSTPKIHSQVPMIHSQNPLPRPTSPINCFAPVDCWQNKPACRSPGCRLKSGGAVKRTSVIQLQFCFKEEPPVRNGSIGNIGSGPLGTPGGRPRGPGSV